MQSNACAVGQCVDHVMVRSCLTETVSALQAGHICVVVGFQSALDPNKRGCGAMGAAAGAGCRRCLCDRRLISVVRNCVPETTSWCNSGIITQGTPVSRLRQVAGKNNKPKHFLMIP
jgi:hypothetical protein